MPLPLEDYALIGDTQAAGLVGKDGSIDWLCLPRFDSGACFAALLGEPEHGRWLLAPVDPEPLKVTRRYRPGSLVLETLFETASGAVRVVDCMPPRDRRPEVLRVVEGVQGQVCMQMDLVIRFDYGSIVPWVRKMNGGLTAMGGPDALTLRCPVPTHGLGPRTVAEFNVSEGQRLPFVLAWHPSHELPWPEPDPFHLLDDTDRWWEEWTHHCTYQGPWREAVVSSLVTLKGLTYAPTGGIVAAPTTSLPEWPGGIRNWDYRFCWLRDATFTLYAFMLGGFREEAAAWRDWLLRSAAGDPAQLRIMYGVAGERRLPEVNLDWLPGYAQSKPVRVGNAAAHQLQLDVYGEVMDVMHHAHRFGLDEDQSGWNFQVALMDFLESGWRRKDEGIWEVRGPSQHFTHSKVMAWVAFDRAVKAVENSGREGPLRRWRSLREAIHKEVCEQGVDKQRNAFTQAYGSTRIDASLLMVPLVGFLPPTDPRVAGTVRAVEEDLLEDGFVYRYRHTPRGSGDGLPPGEGAFLACSFWLADNYALLGRVPEAQALFQKLLNLRNDVGLLAEEYHPSTGRLLGNFPQAFSHVGVINTAYNLTPEQPTPARDRPKG